MKRFAVHDATGNILRTGTCSEKVFDLQARNPGEKVIEIPKGVEISNEQYFEVSKGKLKHDPAREASVKSAQAAAHQAAKDQINTKRQLLQDIIDKKGNIDDRMADLAKILMGD